jgi:hypothetical protein
VYSQSQIVINPIIGGILNMRVFEASACGALLLTERVDNGQNDLFKENEHFVSFKGRDEALAQIERYLADSAARQKVAAAGKAWTIAHHTYDHRATEMLDAIFGRGAPQKSAPIRALPQDKVRLAYARIYSMMRLLDATMREFAALRRLRRGRIAGLRQVLYALLRLSRAG